MSEKTKITLSLPKETNEKLSKLSSKFGMTRSGLINFLINQTDKKGTIYEN